MKITDIIQESSTGTSVSGGVASVATPLFTQKRGSNLLTGKKTKKRFANSVNEGEENRAVKEADLHEDDLIIVPGHRGRDSSIISHDQDRTDREVEMACSDLYQAAQNAEKIYQMIENISEEQGLEGWVQEKIIKASDYLNTVCEYLEGKSQHDQIDELKSETLAKYKKSAAEDYRSTKNIKRQDKRYSGIVKATKKEFKKSEQDRKTKKHHDLDKKLHECIQAINLEEAANLTQQAAIAVNMKKQGKKPKHNTAKDLDEVARSKKQQQLFGIVHAIQKGEKVKGASAKAKKMARDISKGDVKDFASTKHAGLPKRVSKKK